MVLKVTEGESVPELMVVMVYTVLTLGVTINTEELWVVEVVVLPGVRMYVGVVIEVGLGMATKVCATGVAVTV